MKAIALLALTTLLLAGCGSDYGDSGGSSSSGSNNEISTAKNDQLGQTVLVTGDGRTLYALSAEKGGRFVCTDSKCLSAWTPVPGDAKGEVGSLAQVDRPDGKQQATYKDQPLYTFSGDKSAGDAKGEGIKDVGVWHAVAVSGKPASGGGGGGYGGGGGGPGY